MKPSQGENAVNGGLNVHIVQASMLEEIAIARTLFREYATWLANDPARPFAASDLLSQNFDEELANLPGDYAPPDGLLRLVPSGKETAGCVAVRRFNNCACEMKRMWVRPKFRGCGLECLLAEQLIAEARTIGYSKIVLDSLPSLESALALYRTLGFREIPSYRYNPDPDAVFMQLDLIRDEAAR
jgi:ribosomal protein S18 acetylase RimI-like enzyme